MFGFVIGTSDRYRRVLHDDLNIPVDDGTRSHDSLSRDNPHSREHSPTLRIRPIPIRILLQNSEAASGTRISLTDVTPHIKTSRSQNPAFLHPTSPNPTVLGPTLRTSCLFMVSCSQNNLAIRQIDYSIRAHDIMNSSFRIRSVPWH